MRLSTKSISRTVQSELVYWTTFELESTHHQFEVIRLWEQPLVIRQLTRKLGSIDPTLQAQVTSLPIDLVESLGEALLDFTGIADLAVWLEQHH